MKKNILLINQGHTDNIGDIAINNTIKNFFENLNYDVCSVPYWDEHEIFRKYNKIYKIIRKFDFIMDFFMRKYIRKKIKNKKIDAVIIGGGDLMSAHRGFNCALYNWTKYLFDKNIKIFITGISTNNDITKKERKRYEKALKKCDFVSVRDEFSLNLIKNNYDIDCNYYPDVVFAYNKIMNINYKHGKKNNKDNIVMIAPIKFNEGLKYYLNTKDEKEYFNYLYNKAINIISKDDIILITSTVKNDENTSMNFYNYLSERINNKVIFEKYIDFENYIHILEKTNLIISARMHAMILGLIYGCDKIVAIEHNKKMQIFSREYCKNKSIDINNVENMAYSGLEKIYKKIEIEKEKL